MKNKFSLKDKVVVVTGGSGLLGQSIVSSCSEQEATVVVLDLKSDFPCDITRPDSVEAAVAKIIKTYGKIDVLVNSAYPRNKNWGQIFEKIRFEDWCENVNGHLGGYFLVTQHVSREMVKKKSGSIINLASIYGMVGPDFSIYEGTGMTMPAEYAAIKGGLINMTRYLATYLGHAQVRVNAVSPGGIFNDQDSRFVERYEKKVPLGRMGRPEDVTGAIIFLASDASQYVTGQNIAIDGGWTSL